MTLVLTILVPLAGSLGAVALGWAPRRVAASIATVVTVVTLGAAVAVAQAFAGGRDAVVAGIGPWLPLRGADAALRLEPSLVPILVLVTGTAAVALAATIRRPAAPATYAAVLVLLAATNTLLAATNLVLLLVAWEGAAVAGYVLLGAGRPKASAADAAHAAMVAARLVDAAFVVAIAGILTVFRSVELGEVGSRAALPALVPGAIDALRWCGALLGIAAVGRAAQLPFSRWLGDAACMDVPSTAAVRTLLAPGGVLLLVRLAPILPSETLTSAGILGGVTAVFAAAVALAQREGARVIAWLAVAQLGVVLVGLTWSPELALVLLAVHVVTQTALAIASERDPPIVRWRRPLRIGEGRGAYGLPRLGAAASAALAYTTHPLADGTERILRGAGAAAGSAHAVAAGLAAAAHTASARRSLVVLVVGALVLAAFWGAG